ncbi:hypothetical protein AB1Y20_000856 [Prymnesium parvum]|uniref:Uncharacterized protein n=1 Tax=Prymnesium parvum TaxID=97485 RepID=A0AB34K9K2_PRYPA
MNTGQKDMPPEEVTALKEDVLRGRVALLANDPTAAQQEKLVSFMTFGLLSRLQAAVYDVTKNEQLSLPRQSLQALVMASMTGVRTAIGRQEAEYIGAEHLLLTRAILHDAQGSSWQH